MDARINTFSFALLIEKLGIPQIVQKAELPGNKIILALSYALFSFGQTCWNQALNLPWANILLTLKSDFLPGYATT